MVIGQGRVPIEWHYLLGWPLPAAVLRNINATRYQWVSTAIGTGTQQVRLNEIEWQHLATLVAAASTVAKKAGS